MRKKCFWLCLKNCLSKLEVEKQSLIMKKTVVPQLSNGPPLLKLGKTIWLYANIGRHWAGQPPFRTTESSIKA